MHKYIAFIIVLFFASCNSKQIYEESVSMKNNEWSKDSVVKFSVDIKDTTQVYDVVLSITNDEEYPYANLYLFTDIIFPSRKYVRDTVEFVLSTNDGQWLGSGMSGYTNNFPFRTNIRFPEKGTYVFVFEQAMRCKNKQCSVKGIKSLSFSVNKK
ncbi:MAG: gliding motility lipoprotein GldH [Bacteroidales bacterium]|nr:gliding motility lipoprotein GldH [Bacteroidales bacterium]